MLEMKCSIEFNFFLYYIDLKQNSLYYYIVLIVTFDQCSACFLKVLFTDPQRLNGSKYTFFDMCGGIVFATTQRSCLLLQVAEIGHLDEEIMALHSEIVELQRSPYARRQGDVMEQL